MDVMKEAAKNPGSGGMANMGMGLGMGVATGYYMGNMAGQMMNPMYQQPMYQQPMYQQPMYQPPVAGQMQAVSNNMQQPMAGLLSVKITQMDMAIIYQSSTIEIITLFMVI